MDQLPRSEIAISMTGIGVRFRIPSDRIVSFKEYVLRRLVSGIEYRDLWALRDVDLEVGRGHVVGIIGRNGAGKSTLLKVISRVLRPTEGRVVLWGSVAPLLELGAGFHPDLSGRENVVMNGTILGYSRVSIEDSLDEVVEFAELESFINAPLRTYSTGMAARLGFAVATQFRPDILILDEVLAVGDLAFQDKCLARIREFRSRGTTILLVSHSLDPIMTFCDSVLWLEHGLVEATGPPAVIVPLYQQAMTAPLQQAEIAVDTALSS